MSAPREELLTHWEGEPVAALTRLLDVPRFEAWSALSSSNDRARTLAVDDAPAWTLVVAEQQSAGRGRGGRPWASPDGRGLWFSLLLRPERAARWELASLLTGIALARAVEDEARVPAGLKWPNDLWIRGRKAAGILCEVQRDHVVVGVGVNVRQRPGEFPAPLRERAVSLETAGGRPVARLTLLRRFVAEARRLLDPLPEELGADLRTEWGRRDVLLGRRVRVAGVVGRASGLDALGHLVLDTDAGASRSVAGGHVEIVESGDDAVGEE
jgi:BirA family biotin operon repressor/biotin-[acetyl-CoA-carboxylase] ligase